MKQPKDPAIIRAALKRHPELLRATLKMIDATLLRATPVDAGLPNSEVGKTNPPQPSKSPSSLPGKSAPPITILEASKVPQRTTAETVDARLPRLTPVDAGLPNRPFGKTNPPPSLSPRQLAAARLLAHGRTPTDVAVELRITRQGLWNWRRNPDFVAELRRLHELFAITDPTSRRR